jgi:osmotically inducible protein OsmC
MPVRHSEAMWEGTLKDGKGRMRIGESGFEIDYSFHSRFSDAMGANPEELIGAAHAGCFSMALSLLIGEAGFATSAIRTGAAVHLDKTEKGFAISKIQLDVSARIPGMGDAQFIKLAEEAKANCPVSKALAGLDIRLDASLENSD